MPLRRRRDSAKEAQRSRGGLREGREVGCHCEEKGTGASVQVGQITRHGRSEVELPDREALGTLTASGQAEKP